MVARGSCDGAEESVALFAAAGRDQDGVGAPAGFDKAPAPSSELRSASAASRLVTNQTGSRIGAAIGPSLRRQLWTITLHPRATDYMAWPPSVVRHTATHTCTCQTAPQPCGRSTSLSSGSSSACCLIGCHAGPHAVVYQHLPLLRRSLPNAHIPILVAFSPLLFPCRKKDGEVLSSDRLSSSCIC
eukprot:263561-Chlamydomonas_euryale.AAC.2